MTLDCNGKYAAVKGHFFFRESVALKMLQSITLRPSGRLLFFRQLL